MGVLTIDPLLIGQRIKTRKRDEKEKYDPSSFRDAIFEGFAKAENLEQVSKYLDAAGSKLDYRSVGTDKREGRAGSRTMMGRIWLSSLILLHH